ncbi:ribonuclease H-like domain-containing protein [Tanacetum coccineum]
MIKNTAKEGQPEDSTAGITVSTAPINISTARETHSTAGRVVYGRRSKEARKDKGKAIMTEPEPEKKSKKLLEQERLGLEEAIRLQKQVDEEEKAQIARDEEIARQLLALDEERVTTETKTTKDIDWNDPSVQKYWDLKNKPKSEAQARKNMIVYLKNQSNYKMKDFEGMSYDEIRPIFEKVWDFNHNFVPMDLEIEKEKKKPAEFQEIEEEQIEKDTSKKTTGKRKKYLPRRRTRSTAKKQKVEQDDEKEELKSYLDIVPREDVAVDVEYLSTNLSQFGIENYTLSENFIQDIVEFYTGWSKKVNVPQNHKDKIYVMGDLHTLFEPDKESEIWMNQNEYNLIKKKYPLSQEMISKMLKETNKKNHLLTRKRWLLLLLQTLSMKLKRGLATLEGQIVKYREHEVLFSEEIALLKRSVGSKEYELGLLRTELEKVKQEKEGVDFKIAKFDKSAKDLNEMLESQITDKSKKGVGYNAVPSPHPLILNRPTTLDLSYSGLEEFKEPEVNEYGPRDSSLKPTTGCDKESDNSKENTDDSLEQHQMTDTETSSFESPLKVDKDWKEKFFYPANHVESVNQIEKPVKRTVRYAEMYRSQRPRGNQRNWNNQKSQQLGSNFVMNNKACFACGSFNHLIKDCKRKVQKPIWNNARRVNHHNSHRMSYPHPKRNFVPKAVLMKTGMRPVNAAKPKAAYNAVKRNTFNDVKASTCWVWMPKNRVVDHVSKNINASVTLKRLDYIDAQGRFKSVMAWMDAQTQGRQECSKEKEESKEECSKSRKTKKMKLLNQSVNTARITAVGEKVNAAESLLVVSTEVNAN